MIELTLVDVKSQHNGPYCEVSIMPAVEWANVDMDAAVTFERHAHRLTMPARGAFRLPGQQETYRLNLEACLETGRVYFDWVSPPRRRDIAWRLVYFTARELRKLHPGVAWRLKPKSNRAPRRAAPG